MKHLSPNQIAKILYEDTGESTPSGEPAAPEVDNFLHIISAILQSNNSVIIDKAFTRLASLGAAEIDALARQGGNVDMSFAKNYVRGNPANIRKIDRIASKFGDYFAESVINALLAVDPDDDGEVDPDDDGEASDYYSSGDDSDGHS